MCLNCCGTDTFCTSQNKLRHRHSGVPVRKLSLAEIDVTYTKVIAAHTGSRCVTRGVDGEPSHPHTSNAGSVHSGKRVAHSITFTLFQRLLEALADQLFPDSREGGDPIDAEDDVHVWGSGGSAMWCMVHQVLLPLAAGLQARAEAKPKPDTITAAHRVRGSGVWVQAVLDGRLTRRVHRSMTP